MNNKDKRMQGNQQAAAENVEQAKQILPDEVVPVDTGDRKGEKYLLTEETAVGNVAISADAEVITDRMISYTTDDDITEAFEQRQLRAHSGRAELREKLEAHNAESPRLSGGDIDAAWHQAGVGDETVGGDAPTPDQDVVEELGEAVGLTYEDDEPLDIAGKMAERDENRWMLDPKSAADDNV